MRSPSLRPENRVHRQPGATFSRSDENATLAKRKSHDPQLFSKHNWARSLRHEINTSCRVSGLLVIQFSRVNVLSLGREIIPSTEGQDHYARLRAKASRKKELHATGAPRPPRRASVDAFPRDGSSLAIRDNSSRQLPKTSAPGGDNVRSGQPAG
jgi:hypothetical protein